MSRDDLLYKTNGTKVTDNPLRHSSKKLAFLQSPHGRIQHSAGYVTQSTGARNVTGSTLENRTNFVGRKFYGSYNPETGINIASVLGGLLVVLVVYVIYRTKCRKYILKALSRCTMKYFPDEFPQTERRDCENNAKPTEAEWISESAKLIWKERANLSRDSEGGVQCFNDAASCINGRTDDRQAVPNISSRDCVNAPDTDVCDGGTVSNIQLPHLPELEDDIEHATAQWVQSVRQMDIKDRQLNGIILKIPPDLVSHHSKLRSHFNSVTEYGDSNELANISQHRNISLPSLVEKQMRGKSNYASTYAPLSNRKTLTCDYVPLASQESVHLDCDYMPSEQIQVELELQPKVPLDICPIVTVQHYHTRSKRRLTSLCRSSSDEISPTSSSEELNGGDLISAGKGAKYMRLATENIDFCSNNHGKIRLTNNRALSSSSNKHPLVGNHSETIL